MVDISSMLANERYAFAVAADIDARGRIVGTARRAALDADPPDDRLLELRVRWPRGVATTT